MVVISGRSRGRETADRSLLKRNDRRRMERVEITERIVPRAVLGSERVQVFVRESSPVANLPGAHVHRRHAGGISLLRCAQKHW
jgi:hypothetical protein